MKMDQSWHSERLGQAIRVVRWGETGVPLLVFPTAGGDAEEIERMGLVGSLEPFLADGRIKVYSIDSIAGRAWLDGTDPLHAAWLQDRFDEAVRHELVPAIRLDCRSESIEIVAAGASIGAFNAVEVLCRHPDVFRAAIGMSGTYDLTRWMNGASSDHLYYSSPLHYLPGLADDDQQLGRLRSRFVVLATGTGAWENPGESWWMAETLGSRGIPNRMDSWPGWSHDWPTWREMLPGYVHEVLTR